MQTEIIGNEDCKKFEAFVKKFDAFFIVGHKNPDGDCIASALVLRDLLEKFGKKVFLISAGPFIRTEIRQYEKLFLTKLPCDAKNCAEKTAVILEDCSETSRVGEEIENSLEGFECFIIDHHKTAAQTENSIIRPQSPATAYLTQILYEKICGEMPLNVARDAFFGIATDSGFFRFLEEKDSLVFQAAARLVRAGVNPKEIYSQMSSGKTLESRVLLGILLARAESFCGGKVLITWETEEETKKFGKVNRDSDAVYSQLLACENVVAVALVRRDDDKCTVGLRSNGNFDVSEIAAAFGGGGHKNASGLSVAMPIDEMKFALVAEFEKACRKI